MVGDREGVTPAAAWGPSVGHPRAPCPALPPSLTPCVTPCLAVAPGMVVGTHTELSGGTWVTISGLGQCVGRQLMPRAGAESSMLPLCVLLLMCQHLPC